MRRILFTGGGSAGHVTPNLGLMAHFEACGWEVFYIGSAGGIEQELVTQTGTPYHAIATGKLRRYFSWQNFIDPFRVVWGVVQAMVLVRRLRPDVLFSKGGFVAVPVVVAAWLNRVPVITHESDITPGLANRLCYPFARYQCVTFAESLPFMGRAREKVVVTGTPVRASVRDGDRDRGRRLLGLRPGKDVILFFGGSLGAATINRVVREALGELLARYQVVHVCGAGNLAADLSGRTDYHQLEFVHEEFGDVLAAADLAVCRAGANSIYELLLKRVVHVLVPLGEQASRGDQVINAEIFREKGMSLVLSEAELAPASLLETIATAFERREDILARMSDFEALDSIASIYELADGLASA